MLATELRCESVEAIAVARIVAVSGTFSDVCM
jgi:hypothetical protein